MSTLHVVPVSDLIEHTTTGPCLCQPYSQAVNADDGSVGWVVTHQALDGREG